MTGPSAYNPKVKALRHSMMQLEERVRLHTVARMSLSELAELDRIMLIEGAWSGQKTPIAALMPYRAYLHMLELISGMEGKCNSTE